jgi:hypothetical protein
MNNKCFGFKDNNTCKILKVRRCVGKKCPFAKTAKEYIDSKQKAYARLASLSIQSQKDIADRYFGGKMPWLQGGDVDEC